MVVKIIKAQVQTLLLRVVSPAPLNSVGRRILPQLTLRNHLSWNVMAHYSGSGFGTMQQVQPQLFSAPLQVQQQRINSNLYCLSRNTLANFNRFLSKAVDTQTMNFEQIEAEIKAGKDILLIDVRERDESINDGKIPTSKNIPLGELAVAIQSEEAEFQEKYGFQKPKSDKSIVVHCKKGPRAFNAASILKYGGYPNVRVYSGILDWKENGGDIESP